VPAFADAWPPTLLALRESERLNIHREREREREKEREREACDTCWLLTHLYLYLAEQV
jgi:hypothetical protein